VTPRRTVPQYTAASELPPVPLGTVATGAKASWRTLTPVVHLEKCTQCNQCWKFCPDVAIDLDPEGWPVVRYDWCKGCGICAEVCAPGAITLEREG
jgi:2-oxoacid:acceptor oxidoreductase delta subunit (pyruvate/2-ketoisovalerate family)